MDQKIIDLHEKYTHGLLDRREFLRRLAIVAGSAAAANGLMLLLENNHAKAQIVQKDDSRLQTEYIKYPGATGEVRAYLARPRGDGKLPGVVVIHGGNHWEKISWQEAIQEISSRLVELRSTGESRRFVVQIGIDDGMTPAKDILKKVGPLTLIDDPYLRDLNKTKAHKLVGGEEVGMPEVANSQYILNFGSNPYENDEHYIPFVQWLISARVQNHAKLITFDVRLSNTAGKSDEWYPVRPGTDMVVILAICRWRHAAVWFIFGGVGRRRRRKYRRA